jgi:hypothetical protein
VLRRVGIVVAQIDGWVAYIARPACCVRETQATSVT